MAGNMMIVSSALDTVIRISLINLFPGYCVFILKCYQSKF